MSDAHSVRQRMRQAQEPQKTPISDALTHPDAYSLCGGEWGPGGAVGTGGAHTPERAHRKVRQVRQVRQCVSASGALEALAARLVRLSPSHRDPEEFHMEKHSLAAELRAIARALGRAA